MKMSDLIPDGWWRSSGSGGDLIPIEQDAVPVLPGTWQATEARRASPVPARWESPTGLTLWEPDAGVAEALPAVPSAAGETPTQQMERLLGGAKAAHSVLVHNLRLGGREDEAAGHEVAWEPFYARYLVEHLQDEAQETSSLAWE